MRSPALQIGRPVLAVALVVGFYVLTLALAAAFAWVSYSSWHSSGSWKSFGALAITFLVLRALLPRGEPFRPPGPRLFEARQPRLFAVIREVATATGQRIPAETYLVPNVNGWVMRRGGIMGVAGRETMGIGLPLLQALSVGQLRSVLAHEFGHYHGGDTALGPWTYAAREAIERVFRAMSGGIIALPFILYWRLFMRVTQAISRAQERAADTLAARVAGARVSADALRRTQGAAVAYESYWSNDLAPVVDAGRLPPIAGGFAMFMTNPEVAQTVDNTVAAEMKTPASPYDSHPPLRERVAALKRLPPGAVPANDPPAIELVDDVPDLERRLVGALVSPGFARALRPIAWEDVAGQVQLPRWRDLVVRKASALSGATLSALPALVATIDGNSRLVQGIDPETTPADQRVAVEWLLGAALATALDAEGWTLHVSPGVPAWAEREGDRLEPFAAVEELGSGRRTAEDWASFCSRWRLTDVELAPAQRVKDWSGKRPSFSPPVDRAAEPALSMITANAIPAALTLAVGLAIWLSGKPWMPEMERELRDLRASCDTGDAGACFHLGVHHMESKGLARDVAQELALFQKACAGGVAEGCYNVANAYHSCHDRARDPFLALRYHDIGCSMGLSDSCVDGASVRAEPSPRPTYEYRNECAAGQAARCTDMGTIYQCGLGDVQRDTALAASFYKEGCRAGDSIGCDFVRSYGYE